MKKTDAKLPQKREASFRRTGQIFVGFVAWRGLSLPRSAGEPERENRESTLEHNASLKTVKENFKKCVVGMAVRRVR